VSGQERGFHDLLLAAARMQAELVDELRAIRQRLDDLERRPDVLSIAEFAETCGCHPATVRRAIERGQIRVVTIGDQTRVIPVSELAGKYMNDRNG
jgi:excisionase family DNA binding protein